MTVAIETGNTMAGGPASLDLEELLATRLLVQGNSGSGKSHLLRRLLAQSANLVQQAIIDPEGDFPALAAPPPPPSPPSRPCAVPPSSLSLPPPPPSFFFFPPPPCSYSFALPR